jgi:hypothetical protein
MVVIVAERQVGGVVQSASLAALANSAADFMRNPNVDCETLPTRVPLEGNLVSSQFGCDNQCRYPGGGRHAEGLKAYFERCLLRDDFGPSDRAARLAK